MIKIALCGALIGSFSLSAQDLEKAQIEKKLVEANAAVGVAFGQMVSGKTVKASPYSAQAVSETTQKLADGNVISRSTTSMLYRDSEGRERREESIGKEAGEGARIVFLSDPVEGVQYTLETNAKVARRTQRTSIGLPRIPGPVTVAAGSHETADRTMERTLQNTITINDGAAGRNDAEVHTFTFSTGRIKSENAKVEHLGTQIIEGVSAEGTRTTTTIPVGEIGNSQPISVVSERWYSPELQTAVMTSHSDPRTGTTTYKLTNINRSEPSPTLFQVPPDYTVRGLGGGTVILRDKFEEHQDHEQ